MAEAEERTVAQTPRALGSGGAAAGPPSLAGSKSGGRRVASAKEALERDEIERARFFALFLMVLVVAVALALPSLGGDPHAQRIHYAGLALVFAGALVMWLLLRVPGRYRPWHNVAFGHLGALAAASGLPFWGWLSAMLLIVPFGAFFFSLGPSLRGALSVTVAMALMHAAIALATIAGLLPDRGLVRAEVGVSSQLICLGLVQSIFFATLWVARKVRAAAAGTLAELEIAAREIARRETLLLEARQELERALQLGGMGRYSEQLLGRWRLGAVIGRGAMGEVYEATHVDTREPAAVKVLSPQLLSDPDHVRRFLREAQVAASLSVENVVAVREVGGVDGAMPFIAMERLRGQTLAARLKQLGRMGAAETLELLEQVARGVDAAHAAGIVHRDLKPQNLFCAERDGAPPLWKVLDFGTSKLIDTQGTLTQGGVIGTPSYMAPEQARGADVDRRADVYSLGVIAYRCLTGRPAFAGADVAAVLYAVVHEVPPPPSTVASLPRAVDVVLARAMAKHAELRYGSAGELVESLRAALAA